MIRTVPLTLTLALAAATAQETLYHGAIVVAAADGSGAYLLVEHGGQLLDWQDDGTIVYEVYLAGA